MESAFAGAVREWEQLLGIPYVLRNPPELIAASTATFATTTRVLAVLQPTDRPQLQEILRTANRFRVPIYPISSGKNWGYGSRVPPRSA